MRTLIQDLRYGARTLLKKPGCALIAAQWQIMLALLLSMLIVKTAPAQQKAGDLKLEVYALETPDKQKLTAELGKLHVPENRRNAQSRLIELAFVRLKSTAPRPGAPIVYLEGGPGNSGIAAAKGPALSLLLALREVGDVILLDQRGVGMSKPNPICLRTWDWPLDQPANPPEMLRVALERVKACAEDLQRQGFDLSGYNTEESADDIEALRQALGAEKVKLWGISYGSHLALAMIRRHERSVERAVLSGVSGPDHALLKLPSTIQRQLAQVDALMKADADVSKLIPDFQSLVGQLLNQLEKKPVTVEVANSRTGQKAAVTVGKWDLQFFAATRFTQSWGIAGAPAFFYALSQGDFTPLAQAALGFRRSQVGSMMVAAMVCASGASEERMRTISREATQAVFGDAINFPFPEVCNALPKIDLGMAFRTPIKSPVPVLFVSGALDGRTPIRNVEEIEKGFPNGQHLVIEGASHGYDLFYFFPRSQEVLQGFLRGQPVSTDRVSILPFKFDPVNLPTGK
ncbi:MAG TPA: alpha/beta fold hydrolase [Blastocatellia bacterium]|nr:alpha/beta fold hydrolase [Blastocatellia bacterium]